MKKVILPKIVVNIAAFLLIVAGFICGFKSSESLREEPVCEPEIQYITKYEEEKFELDKNRYIITTSDKYLTLQNDGGSYTNTYYEVDLKKMKSIKKEDQYVGFEGFKYEGKIILNTTLNDEDANRLREIIDALELEPENGKDSLDYTFYTLTTNEYEEIRITDKEIINELKELLE